MPGAGARGKGADEWGHFPLRDRQGRPRSRAGPAGLDVRSRHLRLGEDVGVARRRYGGAGEASRLVERRAGAWTAGSCGIDRRAFERIHGFSRSESERSPCPHDKRRVTTADVRKLRQFDLFDAARKVAPGGPEWKALPEAARQEVMTALTRLMLDHGRQRGLQGREARHD